MPKRKAVVLLSGGMDSTVLLAQTLYEDFEVRAVSINYGQRHFKELAAAKRVSHHFNVPREEISLPWETLAMAGSSQVDPRTAVPEGRYDAENMKATVVPNRNMVLLSIAVARAIAVGAQEVRYAAHAGDHAIYPDCRPAFAEAMYRAVNLCDWHAPQLVTPFVHISKADIVQRGKQLHVPFELTWTCYAGQDKACGRCGTCVERLEAFAIAGAEDPLEYIDREFWKTVTSPQP